MRAPLSPDLKLFLSAAKCEGETKAPSAAGSVRPDPRVLLALTGVKSFFQQHGASNKLPLTRPLSVVRHFLETALSLCISSPKPFRRTRIRTHTHSHTHTFIPPITAALTASIRRWMDISKMAH